MRKFLKININYENMIKDFLVKYPSLIEKSYESIIELYYDEFYWPGDGLEKNLEKLYNWECNNIIFPLNECAGSSIFYQKWCEANNINNNILAKYDRLVFQIQFYNPNIIYFHEIWLIPEFVLQQIKFILPNVKIIGWNCSMTSIKNLTGQKYIDAIFTCSSDIKNSLLKNNFFNVIKVNHMFEPKILKIIGEKNDKTYEIIFFGKIHKNLYQERIDLFKYLIEKNIDFTIFGDTDDAILQKYCKPAIYGKDIYKIISQSKIVLNIHPKALLDAGNIRLFEVTGVGSLLLTDYKPNMNTLFKEKIEAVTYKTYDDAVKSINYYLANDEEREKIALKGQQKTLKNYTYKVLAKKIYEFSQKKISVQERYKQSLLINKFDNCKKKELKNDLNTIIKQVKELSLYYEKIAIYGNGNISKLIIEYIPNLIAIFDMTISKNNKILKMYNPDDINNFDFDIIIITAIGYEKEIEEILISKYRIETSKIYILTI